MHKGRIEEGRVALERALSLLRSSENLRYTGMTAGMLGSSLCDLGRSEEGVAMLEDAERLAADLGIARDMMPVANNIARAMLVLGRPAEAERRLTDIVGWERMTGDSISEVQALKMLAVAQTEQRKFKEAETTSREVIQLSQTIGASNHTLDGQLLLARTQARSRMADGVSRLRELLATCDQTGTEFQRLEARVYLAEELVGSSTVESRSLLEEVSTAVTGVAVGWLQPIIDRISGDLERVPIRCDGDSLIIDSRLGFPSLRDAREAVERFLFDRSMKETNGNASAAGRLIGASPFQMHCLGRALQGLPTRPGRNPDPDATPARRRPRKLHWKE